MGLVRAVIENGHLIIDTDASLPGLPNGTDTTPPSPGAGTVTLTGGGASAVDS